MAKTHLSIVIPVFNAASTLERCLDSVLYQTVSPHEVIVVDDASNDQPFEIVQRYFSRLPIRCVRHAVNLGLAESLQRALELASGTWLLQLDADDWLASQALEHLANEIDSHPNVRAIFGAPVIHHGGGRYWETGHSLTTAADHLTYGHVQAPRLYQTDALRSIGGWDRRDAYGGRYFEDRVTLFRMAEMFDVAFCPEPLYHVDRTRPSLSRSRPREAASAKLAILSCYAPWIARSLDWSYSENHRVVRARWKQVSDAQMDGGWSVILPTSGTVMDLLGWSLQSWLESDWNRSGNQLLLVPYSKDPSIAKILPSLPEGISIVNGGPCATREAAWSLGIASARGSRLFLAAEDRIVPPDVLGRHCRFDSPLGTSLVCSVVFGRTCELDALHQTQGERVPTDLCWKDEWLQNCEPRSGTLWRRAWRLHHASSRQREWGERLIEFGERLEHDPFRWMLSGGGELSFSPHAWSKLDGFHSGMGRFSLWDLALRAERAGIATIPAAEAESIQVVRNGNRVMQEEQSGKACFQKHYQELIRSFLQGSVTLPSAFVSAME